MRNYYDLLIAVMKYGDKSLDRTGTGSLSLFGDQLTFNLNDGFPLLTGKYTPFKLVAAELLWFLSGSTNNEDLRKLNGNDRPTIWEEWQMPDGELGPVYGYQWRNGFGTDQIRNLIHGLETDPYSRRHLVSAWNPAEIDQMALPPCHYAFQMYLRNDKLSCLFNMRSADLFLGVPFNIASYALLTHMIAHLLGVGVGNLILNMGDAHIYTNHMDQVNELLGRYHHDYPLPTLNITRQVTDIDDFKLSDFEILNYKFHPAIKAPVAV